MVTLLLFLVVVVNVQTGEEGVDDGLHRGRACCWHLMRLLYHLEEKICTVQILYFQRIEGEAKKNIFFWLRQ